MILGPKEKCPIGDGSFLDKMSKKEPSRNGHFVQSGTDLLKKYKRKKAKKWKN